MLGHLSKFLVAVERWRHVRQKKSHIIRLIHQRNRRPVVFAKLSNYEAEKRFPNKTISSVVSFLFQTLYFFDDNCKVSYSKNYFCIRCLLSNEPLFKSKYWNINFYWKIVNDNSEFRRAIFLCEYLTMEIIARYNMSISLV